MRKRVILSYLFGLGIFAYFIWSSNIDLTAIFLVKNYFYLLLAVLFLFLNGIVLSFRMKYFLKTYNVHADFIKLFKIQFLEKFILYLIPSRVNIPAKAVMLYKVFGVKKTEAAAISTLEFAVDIGLTIFFALIGLYIFSQGNLPQNSIDGMIGLFAVIIAFVLAFLFFPKLWFSKIESFFSGKSKLFSFIELAVRKVREVREQWILMISNPSFFPVIALSVFNWMVLGVAVNMFIYFAFDYSVPYTYILVANAISGFIGGITQTPGGLGTRDATYIFLLQMVGYSPEMVAVNVVVYRILLYATAFIGYFFSIDLIDQKELQAESIQENKQ